MKQFKIYSFIKNNPILITDSENINPASTFEENFSIQENMISTLSFKISDTLDNGQANPYIGLVYPKGKVRLELIENGVTSTLDYIINSLSTEISEKVIMYSVNCVDYASVVYSKVGLGLTLEKTGTMREIAQEILAKSKVNLGYLEASTNLINFDTHKPVADYITADLGRLKSKELTSTSPVSISFIREKDVITGKEYTLSFNITAADLGIKYRVKQYNIVGSILYPESIVETSVFDDSLEEASFIPYSTTSYIEIEFFTDSLVGLSIAVSDFKLVKVLDTTIVDRYFKIDDAFKDSDFLAEKDSYSYYKKATLVLDNSNLYNALMELATLFNANLEFNYVSTPNTVNFIPKNSGKYLGYRLSPTFNLSAISRNEESSELVSVLHINPTNDSASVFPDMPEEFKLYFEECIENNFIDLFSDYNITTYSDIAETLIGNDPDKNDLLNAFAYACDKIPNFENTIYNIDYFRSLGQISDSDYAYFKEIVLNELRKINIKIKIYSMRYNQELSDLSALEQDIDFNSRNITTEELGIEELNDKISNYYEYNDVAVKIIGDNLLKNSNFTLYGKEATLYPELYNLPIGWTVENTSYKIFQIETEFKSSLNNNTIKFYDMSAATDLTTRLDNVNRIEVQDNGYASDPFTITTWFYLDLNFQFTKYKPYITYKWWNAAGTPTLGSKIYLPESTPLGTWTRVVSSGLTFPATAKYISIVIGADRVSTSVPANGIFYAAEPQFEPRDHATAWNNEDLADIAEQGFNILPNSDLLIGTNGTTPNSGFTTLLDTTIKPFKLNTSFKNENSNSIEFTWDSNLALQSYIATDYIDVDKYNMAGKTITFSAYLYKPSSNTMNLPMYFAIGTYTEDKNKSATKTQDKDQKEGLKTIQGSDIAVSDKWMRQSLTTTIPLNNDLGKIRYIRVLYGYYKIDINTKGLATDKVYMSNFQLEVASKATDWTKYYDTDGKRFASYKFTKTNNVLSNGDLVSLEYVTNESYSSNQTKYPMDKGFYYVVQDAGDSFKLSATKDGLPITYNEQYDVTSKYLWKIKSAAIQDFSADWIAIKNQIAAREDAIEIYRKKIMDDMNIVYNDYYEPVGLTLENNKIKKDSFLYKILDVYGYSSIGKNGLKQKIDELINKINSIYNTYKTNEKKIDEKIVYLDDKNPDPNNPLVIKKLTDDQILIAETEKAGLEAENTNTKFTIGIFSDYEDVVVNNIRVGGYISDEVDMAGGATFKLGSGGTTLFSIYNGEKLCIKVSDLGPIPAPDKEYYYTYNPDTDIVTFGAAPTGVIKTEITRYKEIPFTSAQDYTGFYVKIYSVDDKENFVRKIISHDIANNLLKIEYFAKARKQYNFYIVEKVEDFNNPKIFGEYQNKLFYYQLLLHFLNSSVYRNSLIDYTDWKDRYIEINSANNVDVDVDARTQTWNYTGEALITYQVYGGEIYDYMVKLTPSSSIQTSFNINLVGPDKTYEYKFFTKQIIPVGETQDGSIDIVIDSNPTVVHLNTNNWNLVEQGPISLTNGTHTIKFTNNSTKDAYLYRPKIQEVVEITDPNYYTTEELLSLYDNTTLSDYSPTNNIEVDLITGLYDLLENMNHPDNIKIIKYQIITDLYDKFRQFLLEGYYENEDEMDSDGLLEQALISFEDYRLPKISYSTSIIDMSAIEGYEFLTIKVGDKILINEHVDRLYKSYDTKASKYLVIYGINYSLRNPETASITVSPYKDMDYIVEKLLLNL